MKKVIIDCDPGIDDALALMMAFASDKLDVLAVTTVSGNVPVKQGCKNALGLASLAGLSLPIASGAQRPLVNEAHHAFHVHGQDGLGGIPLKRTISMDSRSATMLIKDCLDDHPAEVEIIALGPLTNIALLLQEYPDARDQIKALSIMGGAVKGGNATPYAEFNIYADPHAAAVVFDSGLPIRMYGLDVTNRALLMAEDVQILQDKGGPVLSKITGMMDFYLSFYRSVGHPGLGMHDPFTLACVIEPDLAQMKDCSLSIELDDEERLGQTIADFNSESGNCSVALELDNEKFKNLFFELMECYV